MEILILTAALLLAGINSLFICLKSLFNEKYARKYIKNNSKAYLLRKKFGLEKAYLITRTIFIPLGLLISIILILTGLILLIKYLSLY